MVIGGALSFLIGTYIVYRTAFEYEYYAPIPRTAKVSYEAAHVVPEEFWQPKKRKQEDHIVPEATSEYGAAQDPQAFSQGEGGDQREDTEPDEKTANSATEDKAVSYVIPCSPYGWCLCT
eukprot:8514819-Pyramimonas_sp.AAC.1